MGDIELVLPTAWDIEDKSPFIDIDSSGLKVSYTGKYENEKSRWNIFNMLLQSSAFKRISS